MENIAPNLLDSARLAIQKAKKIFVITGAGVSAESGVPTFRSPGGFWRNIDPYKVATPEAFNTDPVFVWQWYEERRIQLKGVQPNPAHTALARLESTKPDFFILTQNIDDLHERAGSAKLSHIHGKIWEVRCVKEGIIREDRRTPLPEIPPRCERCGALERPNVVWFGEMIDAESVRNTERFLETGKVEVVMVIGTESSFGYIQDWAIRAVRGKGIIIEINPGKTALTPYADLHLAGAAGEILPQIC